MRNDQRRYLRASDGGIDYTFVVRDRNHARKIMRDHGVEFCGPGGTSELGIDGAEERGWITWSELTDEHAARMRTHDDHGEEPRPLTERKLGDWYCSEW